MRTCASNKSYSTALRLCVVGALAAAITYAPSQSVSARGLSIARSAGMAGAYMGLATGAEAAFFNPANLGLASHRDASLLLAGIGANISNNAFSLDDYNTYTGAYLTQQDKDFILDKIPVDGFVMSADAEASAVGVSVGSYALTFSGVGASEVNLNKDVLDLLLNGNSFGDTIVLQDMYGSAIAYGSANLSYGTPVYTLGSRQMSIGASFRYIQGLYHADITRLEGSAMTLTTGYNGSGAIVLNTAEGGSGFAMDLGMALQFNENYTAGISLQNAVSSLSWNQNPEERGFIFAFDSLFIANDNDSLTVSNDYTKSIEPYSTTLPRAMRLGLANTSGRLLWAVDWEQGFTFGPGSSTKPRIAAGAEYSLLGAVPLRAGYAVGGLHGTQMSVGSGLNLSAFYLDIAALTSGGASAGQSQGLQLAFSTGLNF